MELSLEAQIEALLFYKGESVSIKELSELLCLSAEEVEKAMDSLKADLEGRGLSLVKSGEEVQLRTSPEMSEVIEATRQKELKKDIGNAGAETLSIILYRGPISRAEIDHIRGVNSAFMLRNLLIRGLIEKIPDPERKKSYLYRPAMELLSYLGVSRVEELPNFDEAQQKLDNFLESEEEIKENKTNEDQ